MGLVEVRDFQIWGNHIHGDDFLRYRIFGMSPGELIWLEVATPARPWVVI